MTNDTFQENLRGRFRFGLVCSVSFVAWTVLLWVCFGRLQAAESTPSPQPVFPDKNLEKAVRKYVFEKRNSDKPLLEADVANLSTVEAKGLEIADLSGLEKCVSLASLDLAMNKIKSLAPLQRLERLQYLNVASNQIEEIAPLSGVIALQYIELSHNKVRELQPLHGLTNLASLYLSSNQVEQLTPILSLPKLVTLYLDDNAIQSVDGINQLKRLSTLSLRGNHISDLAPLQGLEGLSWLFLERNDIRDLTPLVEMVRKDKDQKFAPFLKVYLDGNPLPAWAAAQISALKEVGTRVHQTAVQDSAAH